MDFRFIIILLVGPVLSVHSNPANDFTDFKTKQRTTRNGLPEKPNIIIVLADDMGYGDLASYGHPIQEYGPLDTMAKNGLLFTQGYSTDSICSPSRSGLLTGRLPVRLGTWGDDDRVFHPWSVNGLPRSEITIAEALKERGYVTGMAGKWHLGINKVNNSDGYHLPYNQGFDFVGHILPFTGALACDENQRYKGAPHTDRCFLYYRDKIVQQPYHFENLTVQFVNDTLNFINTNKDSPFFFYYPMTHSHVPLFSSAQFKGKSKRGPYGDVINEISWAVGQIIQELERLNLSEKTLIVFTSDHGPHLEYCLEGGDAGILRGSKSNSYEGGYRVPFISYWPGVIAPGVSSEIFSAIDLFSSFVTLAGGTVPTNRTYDGIDSSDVLLGKSAATRNHIFFYNRNVLFAVRLGKYKIHFHTQRDKTAEQFAERCESQGYVRKHYFDCNFKSSTLNDCVTDHDPPLIFDLDFDPTESWPLNTTDYAQLLDDVTALISDHESNLIRAEPLMDTFDYSLIPCCNEATNCVCNYP